MSKYRVISGAYFPVFGLNTEIYNLRIQSECRKTRTRNNSVFGYISRIDVVDEKEMVKTITADDEYTRHNRENLLLPFQMQLFKQRETFCIHFIACLKSTFNSKYF